jgi:hypothetical protein
VGVDDLADAQGDLVLAPQRSAPPFDRGAPISARLCWSNKLICNVPDSARACTAGARREVSQPSPPTSLSASIRAEVIMPRSPTITTSVSPKRSRTVAAAAMNAVGSAVLPANTSTATGRPSGSQVSPYSIWSRPVLPSRE